MMAVLGMLMMLAMPLFARAMEISRSTKCKTNLHHLAGFLHTEEGSTLGLPGGSIHTIPTANRWLDTVIDSGMGKLVLCPSEQVKRDPMWNLRNIYIRQDGGTWSVTPGVYYSNLQTLLDGQPVPDTQVGAWYKGAMYGANNGWDWVSDLNGGPPEGDEAFVTIATCAAFKITFYDDRIDLTPLGHAPNWNSGSQHWLVKGDPGPDTWENDALVRLTGQGYTTVNPTVSVYSGDCHYGMSNLVPVRGYSLTQLWIAEYSIEVMSLSNTHRDDAFDDDRENGEVLGRHFGSVNYVLVDGTVVTQKKDELEIDFENLDTGIPNVFQDWEPPR